MTFFNKTYTPVNYNGPNPNSIPFNIAPLVGKAVPLPLIWSTLDTGAVLKPRMRIDFNLQAFQPANLLPGGVSSIILDTTYDDDPTVDNTFYCQLVAVFPDTKFSVAAYTLSIVQMPVLTNVLTFSIYAECSGTGITSWRQAPNMQVTLTNVPVVPFLQPFLFLP